MKKIGFTLSLFIIGITLQAQVAIGKTSVDGNGILDFGNENKGIILPVVRVNSDNNYTDGTVLFDQTDLKVKIRQNGDWLELSDEGSLEVQKDLNNLDITTPRTLFDSDEIGEGVIIGSETSSAKGILILEATEDAQALILPKVSNPHNTINSPTAGTMVYDTISQSLAVFDGKVWNYWK